MPEIIIIAAMAENRVIGRSNAIPWSIKEDMQRFKQLTSGWPCIMGRKTWESLPKKPLPGRLNIIVSKSMSRDSSSAPPGVKICESLSSAIDDCVSYEKIFICGGENIYKEAMSVADKIELTLVHGNYEGDTFFPETDLNHWTSVHTVRFDTFSHITYTRNKEETQ